MYILAAHGRSIVFRGRAPRCRQQVYARERERGGRERARYEMGRDRQM